MVWMLTKEMRDMLGLGFSISVFHNVPFNPR